MKKLLIIVMACYGLNARAQVHESRKFLYLYSDSIIYAADIKLRPDFLGAMQLRADSKRVKMEQVKFFNNEDGFFANTKRLKFGSSPSFSERIVEGRINVFQEITYDPFFYERGYGRRDRRYSHRDRRLEAINLNMYYNKGYGDLKKVNYNNLKKDMTDHAASMDLLESYNKSLRTSRLLYTAAGASIVAGMITFLTNASANGKGGTASFASSFALLGLGTGFALGGYSVSLSGNRHLENAIDEYNK
ncbi:hypothetical protein SAMN04487898_103244 [Pedobacter sp. ok626]|uniref:hypothetical protein n=1 Tax=Pedobacter sp. ok626 TaxID=1761882 RepID=UPI000886BE08|nr:hypothetical protein [Pedobacter sp. ok626]SDJ55575.1 hypothetical protein SAMN04487898_103244 [Pedobacter sp. ok626]